MHLLTQGEAHAHGRSVVFERHHAAASHPTLTARRSTGSAREPRLAHQPYTGADELLGTPRDLFDLGTCQLVRRLDRDHLDAGYDDT